jgi:hypothetical protein
MVNKAGLPGIFIVESPLQLLSAIEAAGYFGSAHNELILIRNRHPVNVRQMRQILSTSPVSFHVRAEISTHQTKALYYELFRLLRSMRRSRYSRVFVGDFNCGYMRVFGANVPAEHVCLLDDGIAALYMEDLLTEQKSWRASVRGLLARGLGFRPELNLADCDVFSFFPRASESPKEWICHSFSRLRERLKLQTVAPSLHLVVGQGGLVDQGFLEERVYFDLLRGLTAGLKGEILYAPHRHEDRARVARIAEQLAFKIKDFDQPIELALAQMAPCPATVSAFMSTALFSIKTVYPELRVRFLPLEGSYLLRRQGPITKINRYLSQIAEEVRLSPGGGA